MSNIIKIRTCELVTDGLQTRQCLDIEAVQEYTENYKSGVAMPPVNVVRDNETGEYYLVDGFHRMAASVQAGLIELDAEVVAEGDGTVALRHALRANQTNGLRRTNADKRHAMGMAWANRKALFKTDHPSVRLFADATGVSVFLSQDFLKKSQVLENNTQAGGNESTKNDSASERSVKKLLKEGKDRFGQEIPEKLLPAFQTARLKKLQRAARDVIAKFEAARRDNDISFAKVSQQGLIDFRNGQRHLKFGEAYCVCPLCEGEGCYSCDDLGWMNKEQYDRLPSEDKPKSKAD